MIRYLTVFLLLAMFPSVLSSQELWGNVRNCQELNTASDEFAPVWNPIQQLLYFNSERSGRSVFYIASQNSRSSFSTPAVLNDVLNSKRGNQSYLTISSNGEAYFSMFRLGEQRSYLSIFRTAVNGSLWNPPTPVEELRDESFAAHPAISRNGSTLVFSSDRTGGIGETDLWVSRKQTDGNWSQPLNIGDAINSTGNEITPFLAGEDSLFFASDGWGGKGGYEIFLSVKIAGLWQPPIPLSELNSEFDDSDFTLLDNENAFFASNRTGGAGKLDIYQAQRKSISEPNQNLEITLSTLVPNIIVKEQQGGKIFPIIPVLYFARNSDQIQSQFKSDRTSQFSESTLTADDDSVYTRTLDIIGLRMKMDSSTSLTVIGWADKSTKTETIELAGRRAESVKKYLVDRWNINENRVVIHASEPTDTAVSGIKGQYARVDLQPDSPELLSPFVPRQGSIKITPSQLEFGVDARPRALLKSWKCFVESKVIATSKDRKLPAQFTIPTKDLSPFTSSDSLEFALHALDSLGNSSIRTLVLPVQHIRTKTNSSMSNDYLLPIIQPNIAAAMFETIARASGVTNFTLQPFVDASGKLNPLCRSAIEEIKIRASRLNLSVKVVPKKEKDIPSSIAQFAPLYLSIVIERQEP